jgi:hypothetical protein
MSKETLQHLNANTLIGFTDKRGHAWHYRAEEQGDEPNHYLGAIPLGDVRGACSAGRRSPGGWPWSCPPRWSR